MVGRTYRGDHFLLQLEAAEDVTLDVVVRWDPVPEKGDRLRLAVDPRDVFAVADG